MRIIWWRKRHVRYFQTYGMTGMQAQGCRSVEKDISQRKYGFHSDFHLLKWLHVCFPSETNKVFLLTQVLSLPLCLKPLPIRACQLTAGLSPLGSSSGAAPSLSHLDCCHSLLPGFPALPPPLPTPSLHSRGTLLEPTSDHAHPLLRAPRPHTW